MHRQPILALLMAALAAPALAGNVVQVQTVGTPGAAPGFNLQVGAAPLNSGLGLTPAMGNVTLGTVLPTVKGPALSLTAQPSALSPAAAVSAAPGTAIQAPAAQASPARAAATLAAPAAQTPAKAALSQPQAAPSTRHLAPSAAGQTSIGQAIRSAADANKGQGNQAKETAKASLSKLSLRLELPSTSKALTDESAASMASSAWDGAAASQAQGRAMPAAGSAGMKTASGLSSASEEKGGSVAAPMPAPKPAPAAPQKRSWLKSALVGAAVLAGVIGLFVGAQFLTATVGAAGISGLSAGNIGLSVMAGILSFLSPCTLPLIPGYISMISGTTRGKDGQKASPWKTGLASIAFVAGFSVVFTALGASATTLGTLLFDYMPIITKVAGGVVAVFGAHLLMSSLGLHIPIISDILYREKRFGTDKIKAGLIGAFLMGMAFAFGWTPCIGPILGGILGMAAMEETVMAGTILLASYSLGLGIPFILTGFAVEKFNSFFKRYKKFIGWGERISGLILLVIGGLIATNSLARVMSLLGLG